MSDKLSVLRDLAISFPVTASFRQQANAYALQYFSPETRKRIYFNTLAILVADAYLRLLCFETNLTTPERWNAAHRLWNEANELELLGLGNLECCVIATGQHSVFLPPETLSNCHPIGYLFIEIASSEKEATLIGFLPAVHPEVAEEEVAIADLQSMDDFITYLTQQEASSPVQIDEPDDLKLEFPQKITYLRNWLNNIYESDWQPSKRGTAICKKKLQLAGQIFEMELSISQSNDELISVTVIVQCENASLPIGMQVSVPDESDIYTETVNTTGDLITISMEFCSGEEFWVELRIGETFIREYFIA
jgi:hypothetical protein